ncbi:MAG: lysophospholipid acyltransferase family protein [Bacteroides sp.]|nr:lysophospholipid acyltransferase family protein [Bacteroides sp.]
MSFKQNFSGFIFRRVLGWKDVVTVPDYDKCVICVAPHTSNWDLLTGKLFYWTVGKRASFMMKRDWFFFPLGSLFRAMGGIPVDRSRKMSLVDQMAAQFAQRTHFNLAITPEGTRQRNPEWKKGFYYIAQQAGVPIVLAAFDYPSKTITMGKVIVPGGDIEKDMREIKLFYKDFRGKKPENFDLGTI